jgi:hypothetical protein
MTYIESSKMLAKLVPESQRLLSYSGVVGPSRYEKASNTFTMLILPGVTRRLTTSLLTINNDFGS